MIVRSISCCLLLLAGCGGPAIVDASRTIATSRGCEAAQLTVTEAVDGYGVSGCGAEGAYTCAGECTESQASVDTAWVSEARAAMAQIADPVLACNDGQAFTLQVRFSSDGQPQGLASHPELGGDQRVCVGRLVLDHVEVAEAYGERLLAYEYGAAAAAPVADLPVNDGPEPPMEEPVEEPLEEPAEEPTDDMGDDTAVSDDLIE